MKYFDTSLNIKQITKAVNNSLIGIYGPEKSQGLLLQSLSVHIYIPRLDKPKNIESSLTHVTVLSFILCVIEVN